MPLIEDFDKKKKKKFAKKEYRPWDYISEPTEDIPKKENNSNSEPTAQNNENELSVETKNPEANDPEVIQEIPSIIKEEGASENTEIPNCGNIDLEKYARGICGLQSLLLESILNSIEKKDNEYFFTRPIIFKDFSISLKAPITSLKGTVYRLQAAKLLEVYDFKPGRGGYTSYKIPRYVGEFFMQYFEQKNMPK